MSRRYTKVENLSENKPPTLPKRVKSIRIQNRAKRMTIIVSLRVKLRLL
jgi:hypothetical protein